MHTFEEPGVRENPKILSANKTSSHTDDDIKKTIRSHRSDDPYLDLANRSLTAIPAELFVLVHIQHLYLEGNSITELPENFFDRLPALEWLDLRNNKLTSLPVTVGRHQSLKNLLLEDNCLTYLPLQLGMTKTLTGLSLQGNPLQHPPQHIVDQGVYVILSFLYQELQHRKREPEQKVAKDVEKLNISDDTMSTSDEEILTDGIEVSGRKLSPMSDDHELLRHGITPTPASLHKPVTYQEYKGRFQTSGLTDSLRGGRLKNSKELSYLNLRHEADLRKEQLRSMKERQAALAEQRRKNLSTLTNWREETRQRQMTFSRSRTVSDLRLAPFGVDNEAQEVYDNVREEKVEKVLPKKQILRDAQVQTSESFVENVGEKKENRNVGETGDNKERELRDLVSIESDMRKIISARSTQPFNYELVKKYEAVQEKIKQHSSHIHGKMKQLREVEADLNTRSSRELQRQLLDEKMSKQSELEYRFRAFTGETRSTHSGSQNTGSY